jgi:hypothetical protein
VCSSDLPKTPKPLVSKTMMIKQIDDMLKKSRNDLHERMSTLEFMEELIELF